MPGTSLTRAERWFVDLADIARMNDWLDLKADNEYRIARWREANER
jgi:hypothetical protein